MATATESRTSERRVRKAVFLTDLSEQTAGHLVSRLAMNTVEALEFYRRHPDCKELTHSICRKDAEAAAELGETDRYRSMVRILDHEPLY